MTALAGTRRLVVLAGVFALLWACTPDPPAPSPTQGVSEVDSTKLAPDSELGPTWERFTADMKASNPAGYENLAPGASAAELAEVASFMKEHGLHLPTSLKELWSRNNGLVYRNTSSPFPVADFLSIRECMEAYAEISELRGDYAGDEIDDEEWAAQAKHELWNRHWIPIGGETDDTSFLVLDLDPSAAGSVGQILFVSTTGQPEWCATSLVDYVRSLRPAKGSESR